MSNKKAELDKLTEIWYKKLKNSGFEDAEKNEIYLHRDARSSRIFQANKSQEYYDSVLEYYIMAEHFLNEFKFENEHEATIWAYHSQGVSIRDMVKTFKKAGIKNVSRTGIWRVLNKLTLEMRMMYQIYARKQDA
jgi:hypothetical protein